MLVTQSDFPLDKTNLKVELLLVTGSLHKNTPQIQIIKNLHRCQSTPANSETLPTCNGLREIIEACKM